MSNNTGSKTTDKNAKSAKPREPKIVPHPPTYRVRGYDTDEIAAWEHRNG
jgi:hypothetical protein